MPAFAARPAYCRHRYSSTQAWNADQSLLLIANGCNGMCFLDGRTYKPLFHRSNSDDCKWHPANPILMICVRQNGVYSWEPITNQINFIYSPENYSKIEFGPYKGNLSQDGTHLVLRAKNASGELVAFAYDLSKKQKYPDIPLNSLPGRTDIAAFLQRAVTWLVSKPQAMGQTQPTYSQLRGRRFNIGPSTTGRATAT